MGIGLTLVVFGFLAGTTGRDALGYPDAIIEVVPAPNDRQVLPQTEIRIDLQVGYEAVLVLDGLEIPTTALSEISAGGVDPGQQIELPSTAIYDQGNAVLRFTPTRGAVIESYSVGLHQATVIYWEIVKGRGTARSFTWSFNVL